MPKRTKFEDADKEKSNFVNKLIDMSQGKIPLEKRYFLNNFGLFLRAREKTLNNFKSKVFPIRNLDKIPTLEPTHDPAPELIPEPTVFDTYKPTKERTKKLLFKPHENL